MDRMVRNIISRAASPMWSRDVVKRIWLIYKLCLFSLETSGFNLAFPNTRYDFVLHWVSSGHLMDPTMQEPHHKVRYFGCRDPSSFKQQGLEKNPLTHETFFLRGGLAGAEGAWVCVMMVRGRLRDGLDLLLAFAFFIPIITIDRGYLVHTYLSRYISISLSTQASNNKISLPTRMQ